MSESPNIPGIKISHVLQDAGRNTRTEKNSLQIVSLPKDIENRTPDEPIRGKIVARERDGTVRIKTEKGDIVVKSEDARHLKEGDTVEIRIPKGAPSKTAYVRTVPPQVPETQSPPPEQFIASLPQPVKISDIIAGKPIPVLPLPAQQVINIVQPFIENLPPSVLQTLPPLVQTYIDTGSSALLPEPDDILTVPNPPATFDNFPVPKFETAVPALIPLSEEGNQENSATLGAPPATIPLRKILPLLMARPPESPISITIENILSPTTQLPAIYSNTISRISVENIAPQLSAFLQDGKQTAPDSRAFDKPDPLAKILEGKAWSMTGTVVGLTPEKHLPVIQTSVNGIDLFFVIQTPVEGLETGAQIYFVPLPEGKNILLSSQLVPLTFPPLSAFPIAETWGTLQDIAQQLFQTAPQEAQSFHAIIPKASAPSQLASSVLFFIAATRAGDIQGWLGDKAVDALKRAGKSDLLTRLEKDISGISRENIAQEWRTASVPLAHGHDIHRIVLHYKNEQHKDSDSQKAGKTTRFIMDLNLSHIGKVQLDGLFRGDEKGIGRLDLALRTQSAFSQSMQAEMRRVYKAALDETRFTGELSFQNEPEKWVHIALEKSGLFTSNI